MRVCSRGLIHRLDPCDPSCCLRCVAQSRCFVGTHALVRCLVYAACHALATRCICVMAICVGALQSSFVYRLRFEVPESRLVLRRGGCPKTELHASITRSLSLPLSFPCHYWIEWTIATINRVHLRFKIRANNLDTHARRQLRHAHHFFSPTPFPHAHRSLFRVLHPRHPQLPLGARWLLLRGL